MKKIYSVGALLSLFVFSSCSSMFNGTTQIVSINSNVKGADVIVNGETMGKTPYNGPIKRGSSTMITVRKDDYESKTITLNSETTTAFWANIFNYGLGSTTDAINGSMYKYAPASFDIDLDKKK